MRYRLLLPLLFAGSTLAPLAIAAGPTTADCLAATESSLKLRNAHKLRGARGQLLICAAPTCPSDVRADCTRGIEEINAALPTVVFTVKSATGDELSAVQVTMDAEAVADRLDGTPLTLDPGSHAFTFAVAGQPPVTRTLILHEGEKARRETITLSTPAPAVVAPVPVLAPVVVPPAAPLAPLAPTPAAPETSGGAGHGRRLVGLVVGGVGVAGLAVGGIFGGLAASSWSTVKSQCPSFNGCSPTAVNDHNSAVTSATVSTVGLVAGGVLVAAGVTIFLTAPKDAPVTAGLLIGPQGVAVGGRF
jgi:hypothetical protein